MSHATPSLRSARALFAAALLLFASAADAATLFVHGSNPACSDTFGYTQAQSEATPLCSIQPAALLVQPGDTVRVRAGVYPLAALVTIGTSGTQSAPILFQPYGDGPVTFAGPANDAAVVVNGSWVVFEGFEIRDAGSTGLRNNGSYVTLRNNRVHNNARGCGPTIKCGQGIASNNVASTGVVIEGNVSYQNGSGLSLDHCYYVSGKSIVLRNNVASDCAGFGFQVYPDCDNCDVYNNVSYGAAARSGFVLGGEAAQGKLSENMRVYNNIAAGNAQYGFSLYHNGSGGITLSNNLAFGNGLGTAAATDAATMFTETATVTGDPLFVAPAQLDFHLQAGSPAIDTGSADLFAATDIDGQSRPLGAGVDIGVDEYGVGSGGATSSGASSGNTTGASSGASMASSGTMTGSGGAPGSSADTAAGTGLPTGAGGSAESPGTTQDAGGCSCKAAAMPLPAGGLAALFAALAMGLARRRRAQTARLAPQSGVAWTGCLGDVTHRCRCAARSPRRARWTRSGPVAFVDTEAEGIAFIDECRREQEAKWAEQGRSSVSCCSAKTGSEHGHQG